MGGDRPDRRRTWGALEVSIQGTNRRREKRGRGTETHVLVVGIVWGLRGVLSVCAGIVRADALNVSVGDVRKSEE